MSAREEDKPQVLLYLAGCGMRDGLDQVAQETLDQLRLQVAYAYEAQNATQINAAKTALLEFYESLPVIKNGDNMLTAEQAMSGDANRLKSAVAEYDPNYKHPNYGGR